MIRYKGFECDTVGEAVALMRVIGDVSNAGWITWGGGSCPVPGDTRVQTIERRESFDNFDTGIRSAKYCDWWHSGTPWDIIAYRVVS